MASFLSKVGFIVGLYVVVGLVLGDKALPLCVAVTVGSFVQPLLPSPLHDTTGSFDVRAVDGRAVGFFVVGANDDGRAVGFFDVGANDDGRVVGFFDVGANDDGRVVGAGVGLVLVVGRVVGGTLYVTPSASGHSVGSGLIPVYALLTYSSRFITLSYMLSQTTTPLESMT